MVQFGRNHRRDPDESSLDALVHYSLAGILPEHLCCALHTRSGVFSLLAATDGMAKLVWQTRFALRERLVVQPLLESFPYYCPLEVLYASLTRGNTAVHTVERAREYLQQAEEVGVWGETVRPVRQAISCVRLKWGETGIEVVAISQTGYLLGVHQ